MKKVSTFFEPTTTILGVMVLITGCFLALFGLIRSSNARIDELTQLQANSDLVLTSVESSYLAEIADLHEEVDALTNENNTQSAALEMQATLLADYDQHVEDLQNELNAYEIALEEAAPKIQLPTTWEGEVLSASKGCIMGPSGRETYYNLNMSGCINTMRNRGYSEEEYPVWTREDGAKMFGKYVMIAANWNIRPLGTIIETSLGWGIVVDTGDFVNTYPYGVDIAVDW